MRLYHEAPSAVRPEQPAAPSPPSDDAATKPAASGLRTRLAAGVEVLVAIGLCLVFFAVFQVVLSLIMPQGMGIRELIGGSNGVGTKTSSAVIDAEPATAVLTVLKSGVRAKRVDEIAWTAASTGTALRGGDGVQTSARGDATIDFGESGEVRLGRNSLIVIKEPVREGRSERRKHAVSVISGEVWAQLPAASANASPLEIEAGEARVRVRPDPSLPEQSQMKVVVGADDKPTFVVYGGTADVEAYGKMVRLEPNEFTTIGDEGPIAPKNLLPATMLISPSNGLRVGTDQATKGVRFSWKRIAGAEGYKILVATDPDFQRLVLNERTRRTTYRFNGLESGSYHWKVSGLLTGVEGVPSEPGYFSVQRSLKGPPLSVELPPSIVYGDRHVLQGQTMPGATVVAGDQSTVAGADGRFALEVTLEAGMNAIVVEAIDGQGNSTYASAIVNAKLKRR